MDNFKKVCLTCKEEFEADKDQCPKDGGQLVPKATDPLVGTVFADKYQILKVLGSGGMSVIYQARHKYMERICAVKLLHPFLLQDAAMFQRFQYEAKAASTLNHPNVVGVHDFGITSDGRAYLVMDYLSGEDLSSILEREIILPEPQAREIFRQACLGLDHAHSKGVIHRDLKPSNLFLEPQEDNTIIVKLVDFGIAKISTGQDGQQSGQNLTRTGEVFGSPLYMSPEQCAGKSLDARSDIYSFGCLMYEVLAGKTPLIGNTALDTMHMHLREEPLRPSEAAPRIVISHELELVVMRCLEKRPEDRFESVAELYEVLYGSKLPRSGASASGASLQIQLRPAGSEVSITNPGSGTVVTGSLPHDQADLNKLTGAMVSAAWNKPGAKLFSLIACLVFLAIFGSSIYIYFYWPGPDRDKGTFFNRNYYVYLLWKADDARDKGNYTEAENLYKEAEKSAAKFDDRFGRLCNVLRSELQLYAVSGKNMEKARVLKELAEKIRLRSQMDFATAMKSMKDIEDKSIASNIDSSSRRILYTQLQADTASLIDGIIDTGKRLAASGDIEKQEILLARTIALYTKFSSDDDPQMASLKIELGDCHLEQDEVDYVGPLYKQGLEIIRKARANKRDDIDALDEASILIRLGQFERDRSHFSEATSELDQARAIVDKYENVHVTDKDSDRGRRLLFDALNAQADLERQLNHPPKAEELRQKALQIKKTIRMEIMHEGEAQNL